MMKNYILLLLLFTSTSLWSQLNMSQTGFLDLSTVHSGALMNDVWGYTDENNNEYAIVGTTKGTSVVDVTDPANPTEVYWEPGLESTWRDIKINGDYAYVTTEAENGLLILDLSPLPGSTALTSYYYYGTAGTNEWQSAHNIWIDENDRAYIFGSNSTSNEGVIVLDISNPTSPVEIGGFDNWYAHDGFVRNDTGYFAHISDGFFSVVDMTDPANPILLGTKETPNSFAHNIWPNDQGNIVFTTDEVSGAFVTAYDITDPSNIVELDRIQSSPGDGIIPHNAHVLGDYVVTSYYTNGVVIHDASNPTNLVEVANYDTSPFSSPDFHGCWGVYPFFASGNIVATDIDEGLFVLSVNYKEAAYAHGTITDQSNSQPIYNAEVEMINFNQPDRSDAAGEYQVGLVDETIVDLAFFKVGYYRDTLYNVPLTPGDTTFTDIQLVPIPPFPLTINVYDQNMNPLSNIQYELIHDYITYSGVTDGNGQVQLDLYYEDLYDLNVGQWGYTTFCDNQFMIDQNTMTIDIYLDEGYYDDFTFDYGWAAFGNAVQGIFERGVPVAAGSAYLENPDGDLPSDCGENAYVTGLGSDNVFEGSTTLISPVFDLTSYTNPFIGFHHFYFNFWGGSAPNDTLEVLLSNGMETVTLFKDYYNNPNSDMEMWLQHEFQVNNFITPTVNMQLIVTIEDQTATPNITEAAIDRFIITEGSGVGISEEQEFQVRVFPNPTSDYLNIEATMTTFEQYRIVDVSGKVHQSGAVKGQQIDVVDLPVGYYIIQLQKQDQTWENCTFSKY